MAAPNQVPPPPPPPVLAPAGSASNPIFRDGVPHVYHNGVLVRARQVDGQYIPNVNGGRRRGKRSRRGRRGTRRHRTRRHR